MGHEIIFMTSSWDFHGVLTEWYVHSVKREQEKAVERMLMNQDGLMLSTARV